MKHYPGLRANKENMSTYKLLLLNQKYTTNSYSVLYHSYFLVVPKHRFPVDNTPKHHLTE